MHLASQVLAICAVLAAIAAGLLQATIIAAIICVDTCSPRTSYFLYVGPDAVQLMTPCIVLDVLAVATFLAYCLATRQARRAVISLLFLLVGGLVGVAVLDALLQHAQATLPVEGDGILVRDPAQAWAQLWGLALTLVAGAWSGVLAYLQWRP